MKNKLINNIIYSIKKYYDYDDIKLAEIRYGLESIYLSIFKAIVIFILSLILNISKELLLLIVFYGFLRLNAFGLHTKKSIHCWISSLITFSLIPYLIKNFIINSNIIICLSIPLLVLIMIYAPADTEKRPLINKKKRIIYKVISTIITFIYIVVIILSKDIYIKKLLFFSILLQVFLILPISYKLFGLKYNNYKEYKKGGIL